MAIDRSKFKGSSVNQMKQNDQAANKITGKTQREQADVLKIEEGKNRFRIYPVHPGNEKDGDAPENAVFAETSSKVFLPIWQQDKDKNGEVIMEKGRPKMVLKQKPIFNGKLHGGYEKDLVEEYIRIGRETGDQMQDKNERQSYLDKLYGKYSPNEKDRLPGCNYQNTSVMYADKLAAEGDKIEKFGRLEVKPGVKDKMNKKAAIESASDPLGVDPFSDPESGLPLIIIFNKPQPGQKVKPNDIYEVDIQKDFDRVKKTLVEYPISDASLERFLTFPPLWKLFHGSFRKKDFEMQLEGLQNFDEQYEMGIFETEEFTSIAEEISSWFANEQDEPTQTEAVDNVDESEETEEEVQQDEFDLMSRMELAAYNRKMKLGVSIKPTMSDDVIRKAMREAQVDVPHIPLPGDEDYVEPVEEKKPEPKTTIKAPVIKDPVVPPTSTGTSAKDRLAALRKK